MNFNELYKKIQAIDAGTVAECSTTMSDQPLMSECGDMMSHEPPKQQDNVTMNVSMNGSGAGGIRDLMGILKSIEQGSAGHDDHAIFGTDEGTGNSASVDMVPNDVNVNTGEPKDETLEELGGGFEDATSRPNEVTLDIDSVMPTGNDMHSKGSEAEKVNGGGNPYNTLDESLQGKLHALYQEIKNR